jgi:superfamily II DNA or RNA helicase
MIPTFFQRIKTGAALTFTIALEKVIRAMEGAVKDEDPDFEYPTLRAFADGTVNLLITTVVAEEGMDVPAANCVLRFDPMLNAVSLVQGRGRARHATVAS